jgi:hypothetical protein
MAVPKRSLLTPEADGAQEKPPIVVTITPPAPTVMPSSKTSNANAKRSEPVPDACDAHVSPPLRV